MGTREMHTRLSQQVRQQQSIGSVSVFLPRSPEQAGSPDGSPESPADHKSPRLPLDHPGVCFSGCSCSGYPEESRRQPGWPPVEMGEGEQRVFWPGARAVGFIIILGPVNTSRGFFILRP